MINLKTKQRSLLGKLRRLAKHCNVNVNFSLGGDQTIKMSRLKLSTDDLRTTRKSYNDFPPVRSMMSRITQLLDEYNFDCVVLPGNHETDSFYDWYHFSPEYGNYQTLVRESRSRIESRRNKNRIN